MISNMTVLASTRYGEMECIESDSVVSRALGLYGEWAQSEIDILGDLIEPGATVLDVGAFLGTHTLAFAKMVGPSGVVHSFEPRKAIEQLLSGNVARNGLKHVRVHRCALGSQRIDVAIPAVDTQSDQNFGGLAIEAIHGGKLDSDEAIEIISIVLMDDFVFDRLSLVKIDAEGMESEVLRGGRSTLATHRPVIFAECNDLNKGALTLQTCLDMDYVVYGVLALAFNPSNYNGVEKNVYDFSNAAETSLLAIPAEKVLDCAQKIELGRLARIDTLDALSLLLLHKPQYVGEALAGTAASNVLGLDFESPLSRRIEASMHESAAAAAIHVKAVSSEISCLQRALQEIGSQRDSAELEKLHLLSYKATSFRYFFERILSWVRR